MGISIEIVTIVIASLALVTALYCVWYLYGIDIDRLNLKTPKPSKYLEIRDVYVRTFELFNELIKEIQKEEPKRLADDFKKLTAEMNLLASDEVLVFYRQTCEYYFQWAPIYKSRISEKYRALNKNISNTIDPQTLQEKEKQAYDQLCISHRALIAQMRREVRFSDSK